MNQIQIGRKCSDFAQEGRAYHVQVAGGLGVAPQVDLVGGLPRKPGYTVDSWFVIGRVEAEGHKLNYLLHIMAMHMAMHMPIPIPSKAKQRQIAYSIMDEGEGDADMLYISGDHTHPGHLSSR